MLEKAKEFFKIAEELRKEGNGDVPIYMNLRFADTAARIAIAEELGTISSSIDSIDCEFIAFMKEREKK